jgi:hypothetical protein
VVQRGLVIKEKAENIICLGASFLRLGAFYGPLRVSLLLRFGFQLTILRVLLALDDHK